jgi:pimeloyl-ACP methyl ester carboxylesterase
MRYQGVALLLLVLLVASGCGLKKIRQQTKQVEGAGVLKGRVEVTSKQQGPVIAARYRDRDGILTMEAQRMVSSQGNYRFDVVPGDYAVAAYIDANNDGQYQDGEHGNYHLDPLTVSVQPDEVVTIKPLIISGDPPPTPADVVEKEELNLITKNVGKVMPPDAPIFARENYALGMWKPFDFLEQFGGGLFMLQEYEEDKFPVIFVHGVRGGPDDWKSAIEALDREHYQPWVYYYPSGLRLDILSDYFVSAVEELRNRHGFERFAVAAHSMGGVVTRSFVKKYVEQFPEQANKIGVVVTVNSPMGGMPSATSGVKNSPIVVPAWRDIAPGSDFLNDLHEWSWPAYIPYHLVFSYENKKNGDGVVPLHCQIPPKLQSEAVRTYGFNNNHVGTLNDESFLELFARILEDNL